jgi:hypothetical protein
MLLGHDHTIFLVADPSELDAVAQRFADAGFLITERDDEGKDKAPTVQKLVCFADGSYIEIMTIRDPAAQARHRFAHLLPLGNGWADYSIYTDALDADRARLAAAGLPLSGPHDHAKRLTDGRLWGVRLILAGIGAGHPALPFLLEDTAGRDLRIPRVHTAHPNGVTGTLGLTVAVRSLAEARPQFAALFRPGKPADGAPEDAWRAERFALGRQWVDVVEAGEPPSSLGRDISRRGEGLASVTFARPGTGAARPLDLDLGTHAAAFVAGA